MTGRLEEFCGFNPCHVGVFRVFRAPEEVPNVVVALRESGLDLRNGIDFGEDFQGEGVREDVKGGILISVADIAEYLAGAGVFVG